jgi:hypothetical protein
LCKQLESTADKKENKDTAFLKVKYIVYPIYKLERSILKEKVIFFRLKISVKNIGRCIILIVPNFPAGP